MVMEILEQYIVDERVDWRRSWKMLVGGVKAEVSGSR